MIHKLKRIFAFLLFLIGLILMFAALWVCTTWGDITMESVIFVMTNPVQGTESDIILALIFKCIIPVVILFSASIFVYIKWMRSKSKKYMRILVLSGVLFSAIGITALWKKVDFGVYLKGIMSDSSFIEDNYADPKEVSVEFPEKKRNLIYIIMESMEVTYSSKSDGGDEDENLIPNITQMMKDNYSFSGRDGKLQGASSMYGTGWTMGGTFAESSGLPLIIPIRNNSMDMQESFFPNTRTLGDILKDNGYRNIYLIGSDVEFGGRKLYYTTHGDYEIEDYNFAKKNGRIPDDYMVFWGYEDEKLFAFSKKLISDIAAKGAPFAATLYTVDTHGLEGGYRCPLCDPAIENDFAAAVRCTSRKIDDFIGWLRQQDFYEDTVVIMVGDHPVEGNRNNKVVNLEENGYVRTTYNCIINTDTVPVNEKNRVFTAMDMLPTTLAALGVEIDGGRLGLGTDLFSDVPTVCEIMGTEAFLKEIKRHSKYYKTMTSFD